MVFGLLFVIAFIVIWALVVGAIALIGGWYKFAQSHPADRAYTGVEKIRFSSVQFNSIGSYNNAITITICYEGIMLRPMLLFRVFHPPIFFSWEEIVEMKNTKEFWIKVLDIYVGGNKLRFYGKAMRAIRNYYESDKYYKFGR